MKQPLKSTRGHGVLESLLARQRYRMANRLLRGVDKTAPIFDIGCGVLPAFLVQSPFERRYCCDKIIDLELLNSLDPPPITAVSSTITTELQLPFDDGFFSAITILAVLEHCTVPATARLLHEVFRVLSPGGIVVITVPAALSEHLLRLMAWVHLVSREEIDEHQTVFKAATLRQILRHSGFAESAIQHGFFEAGLNRWFTARKQ